LTEYLDELEQGRTSVPEGRFHPSARFGHTMWPAARVALHAAAA
jgi:hypothetical protein